MKEPRRESVYRPFLRIALIGALIASAGLSACGRKGPLDPPPGASYSGQQPTPTSTDVRDRPVYAPDGRVSRQRAPQNQFLSTFCSTERVMHHFAYRDGVLHAEAVNLDTLAAAVGTPFYCYSTATLTRHYQGFCGCVCRRARARLLRHEGQLQSGDRHDTREARCRRRCRVGR